LPHTKVDIPKPTLLKPEGFRPNGNDRTTRLADVALAWTVFQHFYPYFDVVKVDWPGVLRTSLTAAATDADQDAFLRTLRRMVAALQDGHGNVFHGGFQSWMPPFCWDWIEDRLVITQIAEQGAGKLKRGDIVLQIDGKAAALAIEDKETLISGATRQWKRFR